MSKNSNPFLLGRWFFFLLVTFFLQTGAQAQISTFEEGWLYWTRYFLEVETGEKTNLGIELDNRRFAEESRQYQSIGRASLLHQKKDWVSYGGGISYSMLYSLFTDVIQPEIRPHQEVNFSYSEDRFSFNHRIRIEQRFVGDTVRHINSEEKVTEELSGTYSFTLRSRYMMAMDINLLDKEEKGGHLNFETNAEIMVNDSIDEWLNTLRYYFGVKYFLSENLQIQLGFLKSIEREYEFDTLFDYENLRFTLRHQIRKKR
ncbi:DUF2490 domain-containing protein [Pleomorphovibrio marinus]|uniref:DUF2490 domain-containing protein n=1 Tax=Pleomorphovibrio marinus TaxID=2164132 RepID=UPI0018E51A5F|nr:DUF2490 domain-containing protein [Pleomorphovibrio marinus]